MTISRLLSRLTIGLQSSALLKYLEAEQAEFPILVLDSSRPERRALNRDLVARISSVSNTGNFQWNASLRQISRGFHLAVTPFLWACATMMW